MFFHWPDRLEKRQTFHEAQTKGNVWGPERFDVLRHLVRRLTFDMRGGRKQAKLACGRPLDGRVSRREAHEARDFLDFPRLRNQAEEAGRKRRTVAMS